MKEVDVDIEVGGERGGVMCRSERGMVWLCLFL